MAPALNQASAAAASKAANQSAPRPFAPPSSAAQQRQQQPHEAELLHDLSWVEAEALDAYAAAWAARARAGGAEALLL